MRAYRSTLLLALLLLAPMTGAQQQPSLGLGFGLPYSGLGLNYGLRSETDHRFLSFGCVELGYSEADGPIADCGAGAGWLSTSLLPIPGNQRHALGGYLGTIPGERDQSSEEAAYGLALMYVYYFSSIDQRGWNAGLSAFSNLDQQDGDGGLLFSFGYQR